MPHLTHREEVCFHPASIGGYFRVQYTGLFPLNVTYLSEIHILDLSEGLFQSINKQGAAHLLFGLPHPIKRD